MLLPIFRKSLQLTAFINFEFFVIKIVKIYLIRITFLISDDDDDESIFCYGRLALFPAGTIDPHYRKSATHREQDLKLRRTCVQTYLIEVVQYTLFYKQRFFSIQSQCCLTFS